jgi:sortase A
MPGHPAVRSGGKRRGADDGGRPAGRCPHLGLEGRPGRVLEKPSPEHRCHAQGEPARVGMVYQSAACLTARHLGCPRLEKGTAVPGITSPSSAETERRHLERPGPPSGPMGRDRAAAAADPPPLSMAAAPAPAMEAKVRRPITLTEIVFLGTSASILLALLFVGYAFVYRLQLAGIIGAPPVVSRAPALATAAMQPTLVPTFTPTPSATMAVTPDAVAVAPNQSTPTPEPAPPQPTEALRPPATMPPSRLVIPKIGVDIPVVPVGIRTVKVGGQARAVWDDVANAGAFHETSAYPGNPGNTVINGHRDIKGAVFLHLNKVAVGDEIVVYVGEVAYPYRVVEKMVVPETFASAAQRAENLKLIGYVPEERLTLVTCTPVGLATHRLLVIARPPAETVPQMPEAGSDGGS